MKNPKAYVHDDNHAKTKLPISDDFGLRNPVIQKPFQTKSDTSIVARVSVKQTCTRDLSARTPTRLRSTCPCLPARDELHPRLVQGYSFAFSTPPYDPDS